MTIIPAYRMVSFVRYFYICLNYIYIYRVYETSNGKNHPREYNYNLIKTSLKERSQTNIDNFSTHAIIWAQPKVVSKSHQPIYFLISHRNSWWYNSYFEFCTKRKIIEQLLLVLDIIHLQFCSSSFVVFPPNADLHFYLLKNLTNLQ